MAITQDSVFAISAVNDGALVVWKLTAGRRCFELQAHSAPVRCVAAGENLIVRAQTHPPTSFPCLRFLRFCSHRVNV